MPTPAGLRRRSAVLLAGALALTAGLGAAPVQAGQVNCAPGLSYVWDGAANDPPGQVGDGVSWNDAFNWDLDCTPGLPKTDTGAAKADDDVVHIPAAAKVLLRQGEQASVARLTNAGTLTVATGAVLSTRLDSTSTHLVLQGLLYGTGDFTVTGTLKWVSTAGGAASQSTRRCGPVDCSSTVSVPGRTVVAPGATMSVSGRGVNLQDSRVIENRGSVVLSGQGYIAADYGTEFRNLRRAGAPTPKFVMRNDGGYYQGIAQPGRPLGSFVNTGLVLKAAGTGRSVIDASYTSTDPAVTARGRITIRSGTLEITTATPSAASTASVKQGATFGNTGRLGATAEDPQTVSVALTQTGTALSPVTLQELPGEAVAGGRGVPVRIETPGAQASPTAPLQFRLQLDRTLLRAGETAAGVARTAPVLRRPDGAAGYTALPDCGPGGPSASTACVQRTLSGNETAALANGDVVLVVESLQNSRYRVG